MVSEPMPIGAILFFGGTLLAFVALDLFLLISLVRPGDERNQIIVWKASAFTLSAAAGGLVLDIIENYVRAQPMAVNPFVELEVMAILYFVSLMYYKRKLGG